MPGSGRRPGLAFFALVFCLRIRLEMNRLDIAMDIEEIRRGEIERRRHFHLR